MKTLNRLKLTQLSKTELGKREMKLLIGGVQCECTCTCSISQGNGCDQLTYNNDGADQLRDNPISY